MVNTSKAIVLSAIKYGDSDLIVKCFTEIGLRSYMVRNIFKTKKGKLTPAFFIPLTQLEITANYITGRSLHYISDARIYYPYQALMTDIKKQAIAIFISEVLNNILREDEENRPLFKYLENAFKWLDSQDHTADFHLVFLKNLMHFLGIFPQNNRDAKRYLYFDLLNGVYTDQVVSNYFISDQNLKNFNKLSETDFDQIDNLNFNKRMRLDLLEILIQYLELHLSYFKRPKSLEILKTIF
ncbi:MAG: DNA repair protein RecO [Flavobacteriaceae bacterium]|nr:DNA repair protein RecO [Flavobacteriaceae bacterium]